MVTSATLKDESVHIAAFPDPVSLNGQGLLKELWPGMTHILHQAHASLVPPSAVVIFFFDKVPRLKGSPEYDRAR